MNPAHIGQLTLILAAQDGCVALRRLPYTPHRLTGNTVAESALIGSVMDNGSTTISDVQYEILLNKLGELGFGLQSPEGVG